MRRVAKKEINSINNGQSSTVSQNIVILAWREKEGARDNLKCRILVLMRTIRRIRFNSQERIIVIARKSIREGGGVHPV